MPGQVYCFNCYNEPFHLNVNGLSVAGSVPGWSTSGPTIYTPVSIAVNRARHGDGQSTPVFPADRPTPLRIDWDSFTAQTSINLTNLLNVSLEDDLILYVALNQLTLVTNRGFVLMHVPASPVSRRGLMAPESLKGTTPPAEY